MGSKKNVAGPDQIIVLWLAYGSFIQYFKRLKPQKAVNLSSYLTRHHVYLGWKWPGQLVDSIR